MGARRPFFGRRAAGIPVADAGALRSAWLRTTIVRLGLAALLVVTLTLAWAAARRLEPARAAFLPGDTAGVVVLDVSVSVSEPTFARIHNAIQLLANGDDPVGMVAFSDVAYELLPPGSPPDELEPILRYFRPLPLRPGEQRLEQRYPVNPWGGGFSAGTRISTGVDLALDLLDREHITRGSILLISDLDTAPSDQAALAQVLSEVKSRGVELRVVPLFATAEKLAFFRQIIGPDALITPTRAVAKRRERAASSLFGANPSALALLGGAVLLLLTVNEWWGRRVDVPPRPA